ncbi:MAG: glycosyltransferase family 1 protein [Lachnospiraceae bacterium]|nr:glycosyltransferase family 1 protein [Lachnospiraceae bacterium]
MRFVLFYEVTESFNYFTDEIAKELARRGHDIFILDLIHPTGPSHSTQELMSFCERKVDAVVCFNRVGIHDDNYINLWNMMDACALHILMDHPLWMHPSMEKHPNKYIQFCPDEEHVRYVKRYFPNVEHVEFLSHAGTFDDKPVIPYADKKYDIVFSASYFTPENRLQPLEKIYPKDSPMYQICLQIGEDQIAHTEKSLIQSALDVLDANNMPLSDNAVKTIMRSLSAVNWMVRMFYRGKAVQTLVDAGLPVHVLGKGWENHPCAGADNMHILHGHIGLSDTFDYMKDARINLNVMPWFKEGTHDRIFNTMLRHSVCLTDSSTWIDSHFEDGKDIALYDLKQLEKLPEIADYWLNHPIKAQELIERAYEKTAANYTWVNCVDSLLESLERCYHIR